VTDPSAEIVGGDRAFFARQKDRPRALPGQLVLVLLVLVTVAVGCGPMPSPSAQPSASALSLPGSFAFTVAGGDLWAVNGDGSGRHRLTTSGDGVDISPTWAPGASRLAYRHSTAASGGAQGTDEIRIVQADGSGARDLVAGSFPAWSPDGAWIAFRGTTGVDLALIRPDGSDLTPIGARNAECPVWSPDGMRILYCRNADASGVVSDNWEIWVMNRDGSQQHQLTDNPARDYPIAWSADGTRIVFYSQRDGPGASYLMDADGSNVSRLTAATDLSSVGAWLPDGRFVISSAGDGIPEWFLVDATGARQPIPQLSGAFDPIGWIGGS
jgi:Tol biopolymer transport system component